MRRELQTAYQSFNLEFLADKAGMFKTTRDKGMSEGQACSAGLLYLLFFCEVNLERTCVDPRTKIKGCFSVQFCFSLSYGGCLEKYCLVLARNMNALVQNPVTRTRSVPI